VDNKEVGRIKQEAKGAASMEKDGIKMTVDTRDLGVYEKFVGPLLKSATNSARANVGVD